MRLLKPAVLLVVLLYGTSCAEALRLEPFVAREVDPPAPSVTQPGELERPDEGRGPRVVLSAPVDGEVFEREVVRIAGSAEAGLGVASVMVKVGANVAVPARSEDGWRTWQLDASLPFGATMIEAVAIDLAGRRAEQPARALVTRAAPADQRAPTIQISAPEDGSRVARAFALVEGRAEDDVAVVKIEVRRDGELIDERPVETDDHFRTWARLVPLVPGQPSTFVFTAFDALGQRADASITLTGAAEPDREPPMVAIRAPSRGQALDAEALVVSGVASDNLGVREVKLRVGQPRDGELRWSPWVRADSADSFATWSAQVPIVSGPLELEVRAIDVSGLFADASLSATNALIARWSQERRVPLRLRDDPRPDVSILLDAAGVDALFPEQLQRDILLLELDPAALLTNALNAIKTACGSAWQQDSPNPNHNCALTPLGQTFRGPDGTWRSSPEYALVRLLTMTPANVRVEGTSIEGLKNIADGAILGITIGGGFNQILAETLGITRTSEIVPTAAVTASLRDGLLATHPETTADGKLPLTLWDATRQLAPMTQRFGPAGSHPGVLDPSVPVRGVVLDADYTMLIRARSNLRWIDGIDLSQPALKDYMAIIDPNLGGQDQSVLEFDFTDPQRFEISGLVANPTADLRFRINENALFIPSCSHNNACKNNLPGSPLTMQSIWATPSWQLEHTIIRAALNQYSARTFNKCYVSFGGCLARVAVGRGSNPPGWTEFDVAFNLGNPPKDQYLWELIGEVAQVALHRLDNNTTIPEGQANVAFTLKDLSVGLTAETIRAAIRPYLQQQAALISARVLGDWRRNNADLDITWRRGDDGAPALRFAAPDDPRPSGAPYLHARPGFFHDEALLAKRSVTTTGRGGAVYESLRLSAAETVVYVQDRQARVWRLRIVADTPDSAEISVYASRKLRVDLD